MCLLRRAPVWLGDRGRAGAQRSSRSLPLFFNSSSSSTSSSPLHFLFFLQPDVRASFSRQRPLLVPNRSIDRSGPG